MTTNEKWSHSLFDLQNYPGGMLHDSFAGIGYNSAKQADRKAKQADRQAKQADRQAKQADRQAKQAYRQAK